MSPTHALFRTLALSVPSVVCLVATFVPRSHARPAEVFVAGGPVKGPSVEKMVTIPDGTYAVSSRTGAAELSIPVAVPPGRRGVQPNIELTYSSQNPLRGGVAAGWTLAGVPSIRVDTSQGRLDGLRYLSGLAGGQRLVEVDEPGAPTAAVTFRAEHDDSFARYEYYPSPSGPGHWRVLVPDGTTLLFGDTPGSRDEPSLQDTGSVARWFLTSKRDRLGNEVRYVWAKKTGQNHGRTGTIDLQLDSIEYTYNDAAGLGPHARVSFVYAPALDLCPNSEVPIGARFDLRAGIRIYEGASRLQRIETWVDSGAGFAKRHQLALSYDPVELSCALPRAPLRILTQVAETAWSQDGAPSEKPPTTFRYARGRARQLTSTIPTPAVGHLGRGRQWLSDRDGGKWPAVDAELRDLDGDGRPDWLASTGRAADETCGFDWRRGGTGVAVGRGLPTLPWGSETDWLGEACSLSVQFSRHTTRDMGCLPANYTSYRHLDFDGDGRSDLVTSLDYSIKRYRPGEDDLLASGPWGARPADPVDQETCLAGGPGCKTSIHDIFALPPLPAPEGHWTTDGSCPAGECTHTDCVPREATTTEQGHACECRSEYCSVMDGCETWPCSDGQAPWPDGELGETGEPQSSPTYRCPIYPETQGRYYRWRIHRNLGDGTFASVPEVHLAPIPLESEYATSSLGGLPGSAWHGFADLDGDGCLDALWQTPTEHGAWMGELQLFRGSCRGDFLEGPGGTPYLWPAPMIGERASLSLRRSGRVGLGLDVRYSEQTETLVDINGDGLADLVTNREADGTPGPHLRVYYNTGAGFELDPTLLSTQTATGPDTSALSREISLALDIHLPSNHLQIGYSRSTRRDIDIDEDGLLDVVELSPPLAANPDPYTGLAGAEAGTPHRTTVVLVNVGDRLQRITAPSLDAWAEGLARVQTADKDDWIVKTDFRDLDGDGRPDLFRNEDRMCPPLGDPLTYYTGMWESCGHSAHAYTDPPSDRIAGLGLLERVTLTTGATIDFRYAPATDATVVDDDPAAGRRLASALWVVQAVTVDPRTGPSSIGTTDYVYRGPVMTADRRGRIAFRGFEEVDIVGPPNALAQRKKVTERYNYAVDHSGRLVDRVTFDGAGRVVQIDSTAWRWFDLFAGRVRTHHPAETRTYVCDSAGNATEAACRAAGALRRTVIGWRHLGVLGDWLDQAHATDEGSAAPPGEDPGGFQLVSFDLPLILPGPEPSDAVCAPRAPEVFGSIPVMVVKCGERLTETTAPAAAGDRTVQLDHLLLDGLDRWHLLGTATTKVETLAPCCATRLAGRSLTTFDAAGLGLPEESREWIDEDTVAITTRLFDSTTGLMLAEQRPGLVESGSGAMTAYGYGPFLIHVATTIDPLGHVAEAEHDLATGMVTGTSTTQGSHRVWELVDLDGFGRVVRRWRDVDTGDPAAPYALRLYERIAYCDLEEPARIRREQLLAYHETDDGPPDACAAAVATDAIVTDTFLDGLGRTREVVVHADAGPASTRYERDRAGNVTQLFVPNAADEGESQVFYAWQHDSEGRVTRWAPPAGTGVPIVFGYDGLTSTRSELAPASGTAAPVAYTQDVFGRLRQVVEESDAGPAVTRYRYDAADRMIEVVDADGAITRMAHDFLGRRLAVERSGRAWRYRYDHDGNLLRLDPPPPETSAAKTRTFLEAADASLTAPMQLGPGPMVSVPTGSAAGGEARWRVFAPVTGDYAIWGRARAPSSTANSFDVQVDDGPVWYWIVHRGATYPTAIGWDRVEHRDTVANTNNVVVAHLEAGWHDVKLRRREPGTELYRLLVTNDLSFVPSGEGETPPGSEQVWLEAEAGTLTPPLGAVTVTTTGISGGAYIRVPSGTGDATDPDAGGSAEYTFSVGRTGTYYLWARVANANAAADSFFVRIDEEPAWIWETGAATGWWWDRVSSPTSDPQPVELAAGVHTLRLSHREDGARIDKLLLTDDPTYVPSGIAAGTQPLFDPATLRYATLWSYDAIGRPTTRWTGPWDLDADRQARYGVGSVAFGYDDPAVPNGEGRLTAVERPWGTTRLAYTAEGWIAEEHQAFAVDPFGAGAITDERTVRRRYNPWGHPIREDQADQGAGGDLAVVTTYDRFGLPATLGIIRPGTTTAMTMATVTRSRAGVPISRVSNGQRQEWRYDAGGRVTEHEITTSTSVVVAGETLVWDDTGNVQSVTATATGRTISYGYDAQRQLRTAATDLPAHYSAYFGYSPAGRVLVADVMLDPTSPRAMARNVVHVYDAPGTGAGADPAAVRELRSVETGSTVATYDYDSRGNVVRRAAGVRVDAMIYDGDNQLREVATPGLGREVHYYVDEGRRLASFSEDEWGARRGRLWIGDTEVEYDAYGSTGATVYASLAGQPVGRVRNAGGSPEVDLFFHGVIGSLLAVVRPDGTAAARYAYGPFGEILWQDGADSGDFTRLYDGKELDAISDLSYYGYRYYDRLSMSWTQADPKFRFAPDRAHDEPRRSMPYTFNLNNPVRYQDPDGAEPNEPSALRSKVKVRVKFDPDTHQVNREVKVEKKMGKIGGADMTVTAGPDPEVKVGKKWSTVKSDEMGYKSAGLGAWIQFFGPEGGAEAKASKSGVSFKAGGSVGRAKLTMRVLFLEFEVEAIVGAEVSVEAKSGKLKAKTGPVAAGLGLNLDFFRWWEDSVEERKRSAKQLEERGCIATPCRNNF